MVKYENLEPIPEYFNSRSEKWIEFKGKIQEGDELWKFSSSELSWDMLAG